METRLKAAPTNDGLLGYTDTLSAHWNFIGDPRRLVFL